MCLVMPCSYMYIYRNRDVFVLSCASNLRVFQGNADLV